MTLGAQLIWFVAALGSLKVLAALACVAIGRIPIEIFTGRVQPPPSFVSIVFVLAFAAAGGILFVGGRARSPAPALGAAFLLIGSSFANRLLLAAAASRDDAATWLSTLAGLNVDAFLPFAIWRFATDFPESRPKARFRTAFRAALVLSGAAGVLLFAANASLTIEQTWGVRIPGAWTFGSLLRNPAPDTLAPGMLILTRWLYYPVLLIASVAIVPFVLSAPQVSVTDRRRIKLFMAVLGGASAVAVADLMLFNLARSSSMPRWVSGFMFPILVHAAILSVPFATAYLVLVHRIIGLRLVMRRALQYALARYSILAAGLLPYVAAGSYLYVRRDTTLRELLTGSSLAILVISAIVAVVVLLLRARLLENLDRRFFREQYDARKTLGALVERSRITRTVQELGAVVTEEIDRVLHVSRADLLVCPRGGAHLIDLRGEGTPLPVASTLGVLLAASRDPLSCDLGSADSSMARLPATERDWLTGAEYRLLVPLLSSSGTLLGALGLGARRSELGYQREDRQLLAEAASAAALALERLDHELHSPATADRNFQSTPGADEPALECVRCHTIAAYTVRTCPSCGGPTIQADVPVVLRDTFKFVRRIGEGGNGIVYLATDVILSRQVAIKTLPRMSDEGVDRLRREARLTARVTHENLAVILGAEVWRGRPMLVFEFLERGTLAERLRRSGPLDVADAVALTADLTDALRVAHGSGLVHGDVKPSNIGFNGRGAPKLLDFGVARLVTVSRTAGAPDDGTTRTAAAEALGAPSQSGIAGTPAYLPPEAFDNWRPSTAFDLWAITLVLYEALTGRNPLQGKSQFDTVVLVRACQIPPVTSFREDCPPALVGLLARGLDARVERRHRSAFELQEALAACADFDGSRPARDAPISTIDDRHSRRTT